MTTTELPGRVDLAEHGIDATGRVYRNPTTSLLYTHALARGEGRLGEGGPLVVDTGRHTGRSPKDKFIVREPASEDRIWWGEVNERAVRGALRRPAREGDAPPRRRAERCTSSMPGRAPTRRTGIGVRVVTAHPYHALFAKTMFIELGEDELEAFEPKALVLHTPDLEADPDVDGTRTATFVVLHPTRTEVLIGGTYYAGEIKKSIFTVMNDRLPLEGVFPMHCSANVGDDGDVAVFFGLSGTGKTTLSADPSRRLIGDDEHGWGTSGVFNIEGGCYAKTIRLPQDAEPEIWNAAHSVRHRARERRRRRLRAPRSRRRLEDGEHARRLQARVDLERAAARSGRAIRDRSSLLTADAFGILPPIARLSREQALYYFLSGFTAKLAGTEIGVTEPQPTFSTCFGQPFLPQPPAVYARMLGEQARCAPGNGLARQHGLDRRAVRRGQRMPIAGDPHDARAPRSPASSTTPSFAPTRCSGSPSRSRVPGVDASCSIRGRPGAIRQPYDVKARELAAMFVDNFAGRFADADESIRAAGPRL